MGWYRTGTITLVAGSDVVLGAGTAWVRNALPGDILSVPGAVLEVKRIVSDGELQLATAYTGAGGAGLSYALVPTQGYVPEALQAMQQILGEFGDIWQAWQAGDLQGRGLVLKGSEDAVEDLPSEGNAAGDGYIVAGSKLYVWSGTEWKYAGEMVTTPELLQLRQDALDAASAASTSMGGAAAERSAAEAIRQEVDAAKSETEAARDEAELFAEAAQSGAGVQESFAVGVGLSASTAGPASFFQVKKGGIGADGVTPLARQTMFQRTGPASANALYTILPANEFDQLFAPLERPDVAYLFGKVGERSAGYVDVLAQWFINTVGLHVGDVVGNSTGVDGPDFKFVTTGRPDVALAVVDSAGRGVVLLDSMGNFPGAAGASAAASIPLPFSSDPVLADLVLAGATYRGQWVGPMACKAWDLVLNAGKFYLFTGASTGALPPGSDAACVEVPLYPRRCYAVDDDFNSAPGAANNRAAPQGYAWTTGGAGYLNAVVGDGYMTSQDNTYFRVLGIQGRLVEFESVYECANPVITHTMALSPTNFVNQFEEMWHINWTQDGVGYVTYWHAGLTGQQPVMRLSWGTNKKLQQNVAHKCTVRVRGKVCLGYVDGELAFVHVHDLVETLAANANAIYIQNHTNVLGAEKQHAVRLLVAEGPEFGRIAVNAADSLAPLLVTSDASPEGVVQAPRGSKCFSKAGPEYRKTTAAGPTGWTQIA